MAQHGGAMTSEDPGLREFLKSRERFYGNFITFIGCSIAGVVLVLVLMAIFLT